MWTNYVFWSVSFKQIDLPDVKGNIQKLFKIKEYKII